jgi:hypothetical protein
LISHSNAKNIYEPSRLVRLIRRVLGLAIVVFKRGKPCIEMAGGRATTRA